MNDHTDNGVPSTHGFGQRLRCEIQEQASDAKDVNFNNNHDINNNLTNNPNLQHLGSAMATSSYQNNDPATAQHGNASFDGTHGLMLLTKATRPDLSMNEDQPDQQGYNMPDEGMNVHARDSNAHAHAVSQMKPFSETTLPQDYMAPSQQYDFSSFQQGNLQKNEGIGFGMGDTNANAASPYAPQMNMPAEATQHNVSNISTQEQFNASTQQGNNWRYESTGANSSFGVPSYQMNSLTAANQSYTPMAATQGQTATQQGMWQNNGMDTNASAWNAGNYGSQSTSVRHTDNTATHPAPPMKKRLIEAGAFMHMDSHEDQFNQAATKNVRPDGNLDGMKQAGSSPFEDVFTKAHASNSVENHAENTESLSLAKQEMLGRLSKETHSFDSEDEGSAKLGSGKNSPVSLPKDFDDKDNPSDFEPATEAQFGGEDTAMETSSPTSNNADMGKKLETQQPALDQGSAEPSLGTDSAAAAEEVDGKDKPSDLELATGAQFGGEDTAMETSSPTSNNADIEGSLETQGLALDEGCAKPNLGTDSTDAAEEADGKDKPSGAEQVIESQFGGEDTAMETSSPTSNNTDMECSLETQQPALEEGSAKPNLGTDSADAAEEADGNDKASGLELAAETQLGEEDPDVCTRMETSSPTSNNADIEGSLVTQGLALDDGSAEPSRGSDSPAVAPDESGDNNEPCDAEPSAETQFGGEDTIMETSSPNSKDADNDDESAKPGATADSTMFAPAESDHEAGPCDAEPATETQVGGEDSLMENLSHTSNSADMERSSEREQLGLSESAKPSLEPDLQGVELEEDEESDDKGVPRDADPAGETQFSGEGIAMEKSDPTLTHLLGEGCSQKTGSADLSLGADSAAAATEEADGKYASSDIEPADETLVGGGDSGQDIVFAPQANSVEESLTQAVGDVNTESNSNDLATGENDKPVDNEPVDEETDERQVESALEPESNIIAGENLVAEEQPVEADTDNVLPAAPEPVDGMPGASQEKANTDGVKHNPGAETEGNGTPSVDEDSPATPADDTSVVEKCMATDNERIHYMPFGGEEHTMDVEAPPEENVTGESKLSHEAANKDQNKPHFDGDSLVSPANDMPVAGEECMLDNTASPEMNVLAMKSLGEDTQPVLPVDKGKGEPNISTISTAAAPVSMAAVTTSTGMASTTVKKRRNILKMKRGVDPPKKPSTAADAATSSGGAAPSSQQGGPFSGPASEADKEPEDEMHVEENKLEGDPIMGAQTGETVSGKMQDTEKVIDEGSAQAKDDSSTGSREPDGEADDDSFSGRAVEIPLIGLDHDMECIPVSQRFEDKSDAGSSANMEEASITEDQKMDGKKKAAETSVSEGVVGATVTSIVESTESNKSGQNALEPSSIAKGGERKPPPPAVLPSTGVVCLRGTLTRSDGVDKITGVWALGLDTLADGLDFEYELKCSNEVCEFPMSGAYPGWFELNAENATGDEQSKVKSPEKDVELKFVKNSEGYHNVEGSGSNIFGSYSIVGTLTEDGVITMCRQFKPKPKRTKKKASRRSRTSISGRKRGRTSKSLSPGPLTPTSGTPAKKRRKKAGGHRDSGKRYGIGKPGLLCDCCFFEEDTEGDQTPFIKCLYCGLVAHSACYPPISTVSSKGDFLCDVCSVYFHPSVNKGARKKHANDGNIPTPEPLAEDIEAKHDGRVHETVYCQLCARSDVRGGMKPTDCDSWVHLACLMSTENAFFDDKTAVHVQGALKKNRTELLKYKKDNGTKPKCEECGGQSGMLLKCKHAGCELYLHALCAEILDRYRVVENNGTRDILSYKCTLHSYEGVDACGVCKLSNKQSEMLECEKCYQGYHMACLTPPLTEIPEGDWFCNDCVGS